MSSSKIKHAALRHFAISGYSGTSLSIIASEVGIKKQSIYAHFKNKDSLFLTIMDEVLSREIDYIKHYFHDNKEANFEAKLYQLLIGYSERYQLQADTAFLLRMGFLPPVHLLQQVMNCVYTYYDEMEEILIEIFAKNTQFLSVSVESAVIAFIGLIDSILVELLYSGNDRYQRRLQAGWKVYWQGIT